MKDPVVLQADGRSYERSAIVEWLKDHDTSPVTGAPLRGQKDLVPNHLLRSITLAVAQKTSEQHGCGGHHGGEHHCC